MEIDADHRRVVFEVERAKIEFSEIQQELSLINGRLSGLPGKSEIWDIAMMSIMLGALVMMVPLGLILYFR